MLPKFIHSILLLSSLANNLRASLTSHSISDPFKPKSSSYPTALLEKRGRPAASQSSSSSSVDSEATIIPEAPVLIATTNDEGGDQGQKRKRVRSEEQRLRNNAAARERYAHKTKGFEAESGKAVAKLKRDGKKKEKKEYDSKRKEELFAKFAARFDDKHEAISAWKLEEMRVGRAKYALRKKRKTENEEANAELLIRMRVDENETIKTTEDTVEKLASFPALEEQNGKSTAVRIREVTGGNMDDTIEKHVAISGGKQRQAIKIVLSDAQRLRRNENSRKRYARRSVFFFL
jgi:hypothetical protein